MAPTNDFLQFCPTDTGSNLLNEADYTASADRVSGNKPGVASAKLVNKALRQANAVASQVAQLVCNLTGADLLDDGTTAALIGRLTAALAPKYPNIQKFITGSGTYKAAYVFTIASGSATVGATYTNNSITYTVVATVASSLKVLMTGSGAPLVAGTLTKASGTGDSAITFYAANAPLYIRVRAVGAGGGGGGSGTSANTDGGDGGDTTFGTTLISAGGGKKGLAAETGGVGGAVSLGTGPIGTAVVGGTGQLGFFASVANVYPSSALGGASALGGNGGSTANQIGGNGVTNTGGGGAGGAMAGTSGTAGGGGGGAGGFVDALIINPASSYAYAVGAGGTKGNGGANGFDGGVGGSGYIEVTEYYQ